MEWKIEIDENGNAAAEGYGDGVCIRAWVHPDLKDEVRITTNTEHSSSGVWIPSSVLVSVLPGISNRDCHELRNAVQLLVAVESDAEILEAGREVRRRAISMIGGPS